MACIEVTKYFLPVILMHLEHPNGSISLQRTKLLILYCFPKVPVTSIYVCLSLEVSQYFPILSNLQKNYVQ